MDKTIEKFRARRDARVKGRMDEEWKTIRGTHVLIDDEGQVKGGPSSLKKLVSESGGFKPGMKKPTKKEAGKKAPVAQRGVGNPGGPDGRSGQKAQAKEEPKVVGKKTEPKPAPDLTEGEKALNAFEYSKGDPQKLERLPVGTILNFGGYRYKKVDAPRQSPWDREEQGVWEYADGRSSIRHTSSDMVAQYRWAKRMGKDEFEISIPGEKIPEITAIRRNLQKAKVGTVLENGNGDRFTKTQKENIWKCEYANGESETQYGGYVARLFDENPFDERGNIKKKEVSGVKTEAASARDRMVSRSKEGAKPEGGPAPKRVKPDYGSGEAAEKAIAKGRALRDLDRQELVDIAEAYGIKTDRYTKPGSFAKNSEIVEDILSARRKANEGRKSEQSSDKEVKATPRTKTKLEVMKVNKDNYAKAQSEIKNMKPGLERDVKEKLILPWIKGDNWMGGINDRKFSDIAKRMPYDFDTVYDEFQKQMMKY